MSLFSNGRFFLENLTSFILIAKFTSERVLPLMSVLQLFWGTKVTHSLDLPQHRGKIWARGIMKGYISRLQLRETCMSQGRRYLYSWTLQLRRTGVVDSYNGNSLQHFFLRMSWFEDTWFWGNLSRYRFCYVKNIRLFLSLHMTTTEGREDSCS